MFLRLTTEACQLLITSRKLINCNSELPCASVTIRVFAQNLAYENKYDLHENKPEGGTHFHNDDFAL